MELWTIEGPEYPFLQPALSPRPARLRVKSASRARADALFARLPTDGLAVVGTRYPSRRSQQEIQKVIGELGPESGRIIVSGLAFGLDAEAHEAALKFGLPTIAVLASGLDRTYPAEHTKLADHILQQGGLILSEANHDLHRPFKGDFLARNRIIAGLSQAVWIVEAGDPSGALSTAHWALNQGTDVYATPFHPAESAGAGNRRLLKNEPALPLWDTLSLRHTWLGLRMRGEQAKAAPLEGPGQALWKLLRETQRTRGAVTWDELLLLWPGPADHLNGLITELEDAGYLRVEGGWITFIVNSK